MNILCDSEPPPAGWLVKFAPAEPIRVPEVPVGLVKLFSTSIRVNAVTAPVPVEWISPVTINCPREEPGKLLVPPRADDEVPVPVPKL